MSQRFPFLAQRLFNVPLAVEERKAEIIMAALADRLGVAHCFANGVRLDLDDPMEDAGEAADALAYDVFEGIAVIPVVGTLVQKLGTLRPYSGMTGYDGLRANLAMARADGSVRAIALDIDSPGGEVAGCFDLADEIFAMRGEKPIHAILSESAYSAAYALASAADRIWVPRTGGTGSVGVICIHADLSKALSKAGITVNIIKYGQNKADANSYEPLADDARDRLQADIDRMGEMFVETVARNRRMAASAVRATQARTFLGTAGVDVGFADAIAAPDAAFRAIAESL